MKRLSVVGCVLLGLGLFASDMAWAQAQPQRPTVQQPAAAQQRQWGPRFVDANGDGICDYYGQGGRGMGRGRAAGGGWGSAFVDATGDGICDNYRRGGAGYGRGWGRGRGAVTPTITPALPARGPTR